MTTTSTLSTIEALVGALRYRGDGNPPLGPEDLADLDLLLTDAFLLYGSHLLRGHVNPETVHSEWVIKSRDADLKRILEAGLEKNQIDRALADLKPPHPAYAALREALSHYEAIAGAGGWPVVPSGPKMEMGDSGPRVSALGSRLVVSGNLDPAENRDPSFFDENLDRAVRRFQMRHGLEVDGIVGRATLKALNVPVDDRVNQIKTNLERWRWLPHDLGRRYILVNIANFELDVVENGHVVMTMRVIVGRRYRKTPVFSGTIRYMEMNPYWHIPTKIAVRDIIPHIREDTDYLKRKKIKVFDSWDDNAREIDPESIDWSQFTLTSLRFKLRQDPGPVNALGRVKFMFPNKFSVYLHDTPSRSLFQKVKRAFSSGCIRIERPVDLAEYLLESDPEWTRERILATFDSGETRVVRISEPIQVHLLYVTAWVESGGTVHFRDDIYERDERLYMALNEPPPNPPRVKGQRRFQRVISSVPSP
jgi:murein L,D-transpeptidase YcbB/YkuD